MPLFIRFEPKFPADFYPEGDQRTQWREDIEDEIYGHTGVRDNMKRDQLVKATSGTPRAFLDLVYG